MDARCREGPRERPLHGCVYEREAPKRFKVSQGPAARTITPGLRYDMIPLGHLHNWDS